MEKKYVLTTEVGIEKESAEWWEEQMKTTVTAKVYDTFTDAAKAMRKKVSQLVKNSDYFPLDDENNYEPLAEHCADCDPEELPAWQLLEKIVSKTLTDANYTYPEDASLSVKDTDDGDWYFAVVADPKAILIDYYDNRLIMNIHNMQGPKKVYFFEYTELDDEGRIINKISVKLIGTV